MENECSECGANLAINQTECAYCGAAQPNADERLLVELMNVKRKAEMAYRRGNKLVLESLLADDYELLEVECEGIEGRVDRKTTVENAGFVDPAFLSYSISDEELLERTPETAKMAFIQTVHRSTDNEHDPYTTRSKTHFVRHEGRWKIAYEHLVMLDKNGQPYKSDAV